MECIDYGYKDNCNHNIALWFSQLQIGGSQRKKHRRPRISKKTIFCIFCFWDTLYIKLSFWMI